MTKVMVTEEYLVNTGNAIREKNGSSSTYTPAQFASAIRAIDTTGNTGSKSITANGTYNASSDNLDGYDTVTVNVPNSYSAGDEGKVVSSGTLVAQTSESISANGTYDTTTNNSVTVGVQPNVGTKSISANGSYSASSDSLDGYSSVSVAVPNSYTASDEGKVVSSGALVAQTSRSVSANGTYDTTTNNSVVVNVPTSGGSTLGTKAITQNGTYNASSDSLDGYSQVTVNVPSSGGILSGSDAPSASLGNDGDYYERVIPIPSNVNFVDYLQSSGTQYINTGIYATQDIDAIVTGDRKSGSTNIGCMLGVRTGSFSGMTKTIYFGSHNDNAGGLSVIKTGDSASGTVANVPNITTRRTKTLFNEDGSYTYCAMIDDVNYLKAFRQNGEWTSDMPMCMFAFYSGTTLNVTASTTVNRVTILEKDAPIADYLPCLDGNGVACMWDNIAQEYVYNDGTGDFSYGSTVTPSALDPVLYVKKSGAWEVV